MIFSLVKGTCSDSIHLSELWFSAMKILTLRHISSLTHYHLMSAYERERERESVTNTFLTIISQLNCCIIKYCTAFHCFVRIDHWFPECASGIPSDRRPAPHGYIFVTATLKCTYICFFNYRNNVLLNIIAELL